MVTRDRLTELGQEAEYALLFFKRLVFDAALVAFDTFNSNNFLLCCQKPGSLRVIGEQEPDRDMSRLEPQKIGVWNLPKPNGDDQGEDTGN